MGNFYSLPASLSSHTKWMLLGWICMDFKGFSNGTNFILIAHCVRELSSINKASEEEHTILAI